MLIWGTLGITAYALYSGYNAAINTVKGLRVYVNGMQVPRLESGLVVIPVTVMIDNNSPNLVPIDSLLVTIERFVEPTGWTYIASSQPDLTNIQLKPQATTKLNLAIKSTPLDLIKDIFTTATNLGKNRYRVKVETRIAGMLIPTATEYKV